MVNSHASSANEGSPTSLYTIWRPTCIAGAGSPATYTGCVATARTKEWPALSAPKLARRASRTIYRLCRDGKDERVAGPYACRGSRRRPLDYPSIHPFSSRPPLSRLWEAGRTHAQRNARFLWALGSICRFDPYERQVQLCSCTSTERAPKPAAAASAADAAAGMYLVIVVFLAVSEDCMHHFLS